MSTSVEFLSGDAIREKETRRAIDAATAEGDTASRYVVQIDDGLATRDGRYEVVIFRDGSGFARVSSRGHSRLVRAEDPAVAVDKYLDGDTVSL